MKGGTVSRFFTVIVKQYKMSILSYFQPSNSGDDVLYGEALQSSTGEISTSQICVSRELSNVLNKENKKKTRQVIPDVIKKNVGFRANAYGIPAARQWASRIYGQYEFKRETVRDWRNKYREAYVRSLESSSPANVDISWKRVGRPNLLSEELTSEVKLILQNLRIAGCGISRKVVISVGNGVLQAKCPEKLARNGGSIELSVKWARGILKSMDWSKRRGTTAKREINPALYEELCFSWKRDIASLIFHHKIPEALIFNMDQTPLGLTSASKVSFAPRGSTTVPISNIDDKRMITGTFCISLKGDFLPIQLIYAGKTNLCHPKNIKFPRGFHVTHTENHWSNETVHLEYLKKTILPYVENVRKSLCLGKEQKALLIYDVFKGQTTGAVAQLLEKFIAYLLKFQRTILIYSSR